jgi:hypothetical protein
MFEAYRVAVKISLINHVSAGLVGISRQLIGTGKDVDALHARLAKLRNLTLIGGAMSAGGIFGIGMLGKALKPAEDYTHQLNIMNMAGLKQKELADAIGDAWKNTGTVITTTATENLRSLLDLRNVLGNMDEARMALPVVSRIQAVLASSSEGQISGNSKDLAYSMAKALDIIGAAQNKQSFERQAELMSKVIIATQGRVTPEAFKSTFQYARQAKYRLSDEFKYEILPSLIQENAAGGGGGGGSRGVGPMLAAFYRMTNQGYINKKALPELQSLGLVNARTALKTTTEGTTVGAMTGEDLAASNPFAWVQTVLMPALRRKYGNMSKDQLMAHVGEITRGNQLAASLIGEFAYKPVNFQRDQANIRGTMSTADAYKAAATKDPATAHRALSAAWENFQTSLTVNAVPVLVPALLKLSRGLNTLGDWARKHPNLSKDVVIGFGALAGVLAVGGPLLTGIAVTRLAFSGLGGVLGGGVGGAGGGLAGGVTSLAGSLKVLGIAAAPLLAMFAVKEWAEDKSHDKERTETLMSWSDKLKSILPGWLGDPRRADQEMYKKMRRDLDGSGFDYVRPRPAQPMMINNKIVMPDGRVLAYVVTQEQSKDAAKPQAGAARFDGRMTPAHVGASGRW